MLRPEVVQKRLEKIEEYLHILRHMRRHPRDAFLVDPEKYGSAERFLQLVMEALTDLGNHVIADGNLGTVDSSADIPRLLCGKGHLDADLRDIWIRMIGFRNILVHEYLEVDRGLVFDVLQNRLDDIVKLCRVFRSFL
jgi:uncharacterized protein YutE (UPF0331/DUF86 family)